MSYLLDTHVLLRAAEVPRWPAQDVQAPLEGKNSGAVQ